MTILNGVYSSGAAVLSWFTNHRNYRDISTITPSEIGVIGVIKQLTWGHHLVDPKNEGKSTGSHVFFPSFKPNFSTENYVGNVHPGLIKSG